MKSGPDTRSRLTIPRDQDLIAACAREFVAACKGDLPLPKPSIILLPNEIDAPRLRLRLLQEAKAQNAAAAMVLPTITTLRKLVRMRCTYRNSISGRRATLLLGASLNDNPQLFPDMDCWQSARKLLALFDEIDEITEITGKPPPLHEEADALNKIHLAWRKATDGMKTDSAHYREALRNNAFISPGEKVFLCGMDSMTPAETLWAEELASGDQLTVIAYEPTEQASASARALNFVWRHSPETLADQAKSCADSFPKSPLNRIRIYKAENLELHALGIRIRITEWLHQGIQNIAVVTQDRKLARRLRALLERKSIPVYDHAGWALSTTTSATALLYLVPSAAAGFTVTTVLNLLRSPYRNPLPRSRRLEADIRLIKRCTDHIPYGSDQLDRRKKLIGDLQLSTATHKELNTITKSLSKLQALRTTGKPCRFTEFLDALCEAMSELGMTGQFEQDEAGQKILAQINAMQEAARQENISGNWALWRSWLIHELEKENFVPPSPGAGITFCNLNQSLLLNAEALVFASLARRHLQPASDTILLNDAARNRLGLTGKASRTDLLEQRSQMLIERAGRVLLTHQTKENGRTPTAVTWLDELQHFHKLAYNTDLNDEALGAEARTAIRTGTMPVAAPLPSRALMPRPEAPADLWPKSLSAQSYKTAVSCPYKFFAAYCLRIDDHKPGEEYGSELFFGQNLHRCLAKLHDRHPGLPAADQPWTHEHVDAARRIADEIVAAELHSTNNEHYAAAWQMRRLQTALHQYIDWLVEPQLGENVTVCDFVTEHEPQKTLSDDMAIHGRLDCMMKSNEEDGKRKLHIIDYKTTPPRKNAVSTGEDVQLALYMLLADDAETASYLGINGRKITPLSFTDETLKPATHRDRLIRFRHAYKTQQELPAWAEEKHCDHCNYSGVCRRRTWRTLGDTAAASTVAEKSP